MLDKGGYSSAASGEMYNPIVNAAIINSQSILDCLDIMLLPDNNVFENGHLIGLVKVACAQVVILRSALNHDHSNPNHLDADRSQKDIEDKILSYREKLMKFK